MNSNNDKVKHYIMHHKFLPYTFVIISILFSTISFSQTEQDVISEANRLEINSREKAISELAARGISESQAKEMAQLRGIDFDIFLDNYLKNNNDGLKTAKTNISNDVVTDLKVTSAPVVVAVPPIPKVVVEKDIKNYFGYDIFVNNPFGQKEYLLGNIDEGYILAPGDELRITVFGDNNLEFVSKIDLNGNISFPNLGVFFAAGNSFATVKKRLKVFLGKYYSGLLSSPNRTFLDVSLTQIRPVKVSVLGNVNAPGSYALDIYKDLKTLINTGAKGVSINTYFQKLDINSEDSQGNLSFKTYNLSSVLNDKVTVALQENDRVKIYSLEEVRGEQKVTISGFVSEPKTVFWSENLSIFDLIFQSVSYDELEFQSKVLTSRLDLNRFDGQTGLYNLTQYSLDRLEDLKATYLMPKDKVVLYTKSVTQDISPTFKVLGKVSNPGEFSLGNTTYVEDAILIAGGFLDVADQTFVNINRMDRDLEKGTYSKLNKYQLDIDYMLGNKDKPSNPFILENKDIITVISPIRALGQPIVSIEGEVNYPQLIIIESDRVALNKMIDLAGGLTRNASLRSSYIIRDGSKVHLDLNKKLDFKTTTLVDNDIIVIGSTLETIKTSGALLNPTNFIWNEGKRARYYIRKSGGTKKRIESMEVRQANGKTEKIGLFKNPTIYPGSQIIVTEKPAKTKDGNVNKFIDNFIRIFGVVTGALTTIILTKNL